MDVDGAVEGGRHRGAGGDDVMKTVVVVIDGGVDVVVEGGCGDVKLLLLLLRLMDELVLMVLLLLLRETRLLQLLQLWLLLMGQLEVHLSRDRCRAVVQEATLSGVLGETGAELLGFGLQLQHVRLHLLLLLLQHGDLIEQLIGLVDASLAATRCGEFVALAAHLSLLLLGRRQIGGILWAAAARIASRRRCGGGCWKECAEDLGLDGVDRLRCAYADTHYSCCWSRPPAWAAARSTSYSWTSPSRTSPGCSPRRRAGCAGPVAAGDIAAAAVAAVAAVAAAVDADDYDYEATATGATGAAAVAADCDVTD